MEPATLIQVVDQAGCTVRLIEKLDAHREGGVLHRAVSVVLIDADGRVLLQQRAATKYHFAGLWANACCTHPREDETALQAGLRCLQTELGASTLLQEVSRIVYEARDPASGYVEREYDHILFGVITGPISPNPEEVEAVKFVQPSVLRDLVASSPQEFAPWVGKILESFVLLGDEIPVPLRSLVESLS